MPRGLTGPLLALGLLAACSAKAAAGSLCDDLFLPDELGLACALEEGGAIAVVRPGGGAFADLSRLRLRTLDEDEDPLAWHDPVAWLESRLTLDLEVARDGIGALADDPDNPFGRGGMTNAVGYLFDMLEDLGSMALSGCKAVAPVPGKADTMVQACEWGIGPVGLKLENRIVVAPDDARYAITLWTMNERRMRHLQAIANSFDPAS